MIELYESQIAQILPDHLAKQEEVRALSFALSKAVQRAMGYCKYIGIFVVIDSAPGYVLDMMAEDLDTQYYDNSLKIEEKRKLVKNTLVWYTRAGTPAAVEELVNTVFEKGDVKEWFQYDGRPYFFKISTDADMNSESMKFFEGMIAKVKNTRSHMENIEFHREVEESLYMYGICLSQVRADIGWEE